MSRKKKKAASKGARPTNSAPLSTTHWGTRWAGWAVVALLAVPPLLVSVTAREAFRLPKLMASQWLALVSLFCLAWVLTTRERVDWKKVMAAPVIRITLPILAVATLGLAFTIALHFTRDGLIDLWIGAACFVAWSLAFSATRLRSLLNWMMIPAGVLSVFAILQFHGGQPLAFLGEQDARLGVTSLAGNPGDLGAYLVLPCLLAQLGVWDGFRGKGRRWLWLVALVVCLYALAVTQTLTALIGLAVASLVLWCFLLPRRRALAILGGGAVLVAVAVLAVAPLRTRVVDKLDDLRKGEVNRVLTGRLDGWWAATWMFQRHPITGVGHGAYRAEFSQAKLALTEEGTKFLKTHNQPFFANAHNEYLEVAAEWGIPGLAALGWALWLLFGSLRRLDPSTDRALAWAGVAGWAVIALTSFPFRIALTAYPALLFLAWVIRRGTVEGRVVVESEEAA